MNILLFTIEYPPFAGGVANYYGNLVKYWPAPGHIFVLNNNDGKLIKNNWPILKWLPSAWALFKTVKQKKIDHLVVGQVLPLGIAALFCRYILKVNYTVFLHGMDFNYASKTWRKRKILAVILKRAKTTICVNSYTASLVKSFFKSETAISLAIINPGAEAPARDQVLINQLTEKYGLNNKIILLSVGRLVRRKGFDLIIGVLPEILKKIPSLIYFILGQGREHKNLENRINNLGLKNRAFIISQAADEERDAWYNLCDIFLMPARNIDGDFEGFGIVYLEANLAAKPVIAARSGGVDDAVINGLNGLLINSENPPELIEAILKLALDQDLKNKLGRQGLERATNKFNWPKQVKKIYNFINN